VKLEARLVKRDKNGEMKLMMIPKMVLMMLLNTVFPLYFVRSEMEIRGDVNHCRRGQSTKQGERVNKKVNVLLKRT
jgi:hypothetical protein